MIVPFVFALQVIDNWNVGAAVEQSFVVPNKFGCTTVPIGFMMILSVDTSDGGYEEENYIAELQIVKLIMVEEEWMGTKDFSTSSSDSRVVARSLRVLTDSTGLHGPVPRRRRSGRGDQSKNYVAFIC